MLQLTISVLCLEFRNCIYCYKCAFTGMAGTFQFK